MNLQQSAQRMIDRGLSFGLRDAFAPAPNLTPAMQAILRRLDDIDATDAVEMLRDDKARRRP